MIEKRESTLPIYFVGDSHVLPLANLIFHHPRAGQTFHTVTKFCGGIKSRSFFSHEAGGLDQRLVAGMAGVGLLLNDGTPAHLATDDGHLNINFAKGEAALMPLLVLSAGCQDARGVVLQEFHRDYDFRLPADAPDYGFDASKQEIPFTVVENAVNTLVQPYIDGVKKLLEVGFFGVAVLGLPPPTADDDAFERVNGYRTSLALRYKVYWLFNHILKTRCAAAHWMPFIDIWPRITDERGILKPAYELDGTHVGREASWITLEKVVDVAIDTGLKANHAMYALAQKHAAPVTPALAASARYQTLRKAFADNSFFVIDTDISAFAPIAERMVFDRPQMNQHITFDWCGRNYLDGGDRTPHLRNAEIPEDGVQALYSMFYDQPEVREAIQAACGADFLVYRAAARKTLVTGLQPDSEDWHRDGCPPGIVRGILYVSDVDASSGPLQFLEGPSPREARSMVKVLGKSGTLILFDAQRFHRGAKAWARERVAIDIVFGPRIPSIPRMVIQSDFNTWPGDPFHFSLDNAVVYPNPGVGKVVAHPLWGTSNVAAPPA